jgi:hypothetical protein
MTGAPALLIILAMVGMGVWWIVRFRDAIGYAIGGIVLVVAYSVATTGGPPEFGEHKPLAMVLVFGGLLLLFAIDTTTRATAMGKAARRAGSPAGTAGAGCAWLSTMAVIVILAAIVLAAAGGGR